MNQRSPDELQQELQGLDQAHAQNEAARDSFVALAHTALFAASVSFVGSAVPLVKAVWLPALIAGWAVDVLGLLSLTISFATARKAIDARREAIYADTPPIAIWSDRLNSFALWSFPAALLCLFSFVTANVVYINGQQTKLVTSTIAAGRLKGDNSCPAGAIASGRCLRTAGRRCPATQGADRSAPSSPTPRSC
jgi:hypothetical protein